ncbi:MAG: hypothetical protein CME06_12385 [Gemmatimonadetes bacterium]|nr:hypothetical protein [Gemmatimonadota bacterium]
MLLQLAAMASDITRSGYTQKIDMAVARQALDQQKIEGRGVIELLESAPPPPTPGKGLVLDIMA